MRTAAKSSRASRSPDNVIPANRIDPAAKVLTELLGTRQQGPAMPFTAVNNFTANASVGGDNDQYNGRVDHTFSEKNRALRPVHLLDEPESAIDPYRTQDLRRPLYRNLQHEPGRIRATPTRSHPR